MNSFRSGAAFMLIEKLIKMGTQLAIMVLLARFLGPEQLGTLMYCYALASLFVFLNNFGLNNLLVKWFVEDECNSANYLKQALILRVSAGLISIILINILGLWLVNEDARGLLLVISVYHLLLPISTIEWFFQSRGKSELAAYGLLAGSISGFLFRVWCLLAGQDLIWLGVAYSFELFIVAIVYFLIWRSYQTDGPIVTEYSEGLWTMVKRALPLLMSGAIIMLYMRIDQLMLGYFVNDAEVGVYSAAVRLSEAWYLLGMTIIGVYFPYYLKIRNTEGAGASLVSLVSFGRIVVWFGVLLALVVFFISDYIVAILYGDEFSASADVLVVSIFAVPFVYLGSICAKYLVAIQQLKGLLYRSILALIVNCILNVLLIPTYGAVGAAVGLLVSQVIVGLFYELCRNNKEMKKIIFGILFFAKPEKYVSEI